MRDFKEAEVVQEVYLLPRQPEFRRFGLKYLEDLRLESVRENREQLVRKIQELSEAEFTLSTTVDLIAYEDAAVKSLMQEYPEFAKALSFGGDARYIFNDLKKLTAGLEEALDLPKGWHNLEFDEGQASGMYGAEVAEVYFLPREPVVRRPGLRLPEDMKADCARETRRLLVENLQKLSDVKFVLATIADLIAPQGYLADRLMQEYPELAKAVTLGGDVRFLLKELELLIAGLEEALDLPKGWHNLESDEGQLE